jgi:hypothetical protein
MNRIVRRAVLEFSVLSRRRKAQQMTAFMSQYGLRTVVLSGALDSGSQPNESIVERAVIDAADLAVVCDIEYRLSAWPIILADGRAMPFRDKAVDFALANAVIEHVGDDKAQRQLVAEHVRVARHWVITTPNRWFPVESHTSVVLLHWMPKWRAERAEFTRLLSRREFRKLLPDKCHVQGKPWSATLIASSAPLPSP